MSKRLKLAKLYFGKRPKRLYTDVTTTQAGKNIKGPSWQSLISLTPKQAKCQTGPGWQKLDSGIQEPKKHREESTLKGQIGRCFYISFSYELINEKYVGILK